MEPILTREPEAGIPTVRVVLESVITVPSEHVQVLLGALGRAGIEAWDTGTRTTTEEAIDALADLRVRVPA